MSINITDYPDVRSRAKELGLAEPVNMSFLPRGFLEAEETSALANEASVSTLRTLFRQRGLEETKLDSQVGKFPVVHENALEWVAPILFFTAAHISENPEAISIACGVIASHVTDLFKGTNRNPSVKLEVIVETTKSKKTKKISYEGSPDGIKDLAEAIKETVGD